MRPENRSFQTVFLSLSSFFWGEIWDLVVSSGDENTVSDETETKKKQGL